METNNSSDNFFTLGIDANAKEFLQVAATWAKIIAIVSFISAGVSVLTAIFNKGASSQNILAIGASITGALITAGITITINIFLLRFASNISGGLTAMNQQQFSEGASNLRIYFKFLGILFIIFLSLFAVGLLFFFLGKGISQ